MFTYLLSKSGMYSIPRYNFGTGYSLYFCPGTRTNWQYAAGGSVGTRGFVGDQYVNARVSVRPVSLVTRGFL